MYKIYADDTLIYDSTAAADYKIAKGVVNLELGKPGTFEFAVYPDHPFYSNFKIMGMVIKVTRSNKILFRGRIIRESKDYHNCKVLTCEGELAFLRDAVLSPEDNGSGPTERELLGLVLHEHALDTQAFQRFNTGTVDVVHPISPGAVALYTDTFISVYDYINSVFVEMMGGTLFITHGDDGTVDKPTLNVIDGPINTAEQVIDFSSNLVDFKRIVNTDTLITALAPLGRANSDGSVVTIQGNYGTISDADAIAEYGEITEIKEFTEATDSGLLYIYAQKYLADAIAASVSIEVSSVDKHMLDPTISAFELGDKVNFKSLPHGYPDYEGLICTQMSINLLRPDTDKLVFGATMSTFTDTTAKTANLAKRVPNLEEKVSNMLTEPLVNSSTSIPDMISRIEALENA